LCSFFCSAEPPPSQNAISRLSHFGRVSIPKKLLLIAYHFPPFQGSTGVHRTLAFAKYLKDYDWEVTILTAHPRAYPSVSEQNSSAVPAHVKVVRAFAVDAQRHLALFGRYLSLLAVPDRWQSWIAGGFVSGARIIRNWSPDAIMSTYPIASAHVIAAGLQRAFILPWIADMRDPMLQEEYPTDLRLRRAYLAIERSIFSRAAQVTVTTTGAADLYRDRYPGYPSDAIVAIPNGFDEDAFEHLTGRPAPVQTGARRKLQFLHSGLLYPKERNPTQFFAAAAELRAAGLLSPDDVEFVFRGSGNESAYSVALDQLRLNELIRLAPAIPYADALTEMSNADACMLFQASSCNQQIPAKVYEYLYSRKPIFALTDPVGDTGRLLSEMNIAPVTPLDDKEKIKKELPAFIQQLRDNRVPLPGREQVMRHSRRALTRRLAEVLDDLIDRHRTVRSS
jgi:glycosyltransferase involved in cell wall biosynthesis